MNYKKIKVRSKTLLYHYQCLAYIFYLANHLNKFLIISNYVIKHNCYFLYKKSEFDQNLRLRLLACIKLGSMRATCLRLTSLTTSLASNIFVMYLLCQIVDQNASINYKNILNYLIFSQKVALFS